MSFRETEEQRRAETPTTKQPWETMKLSYIGHVSKLVQGGGGKIPSIVADPGEARKTVPSG
jgi:hypothetical protein